MYKANDSQQGGSYYKTKAIQPWDYITANEMGYLEGNVVKYITRWRQKDGLKDLRKAQHYLQKLIETELEPKEAHTRKDYDSEPEPDWELEAPELDSVNESYAPRKGKKLDKCILGSSRRSDHKGPLARPFPGRNTCGTCGESWQLL